MQISTLKQLNIKSSFRHFFRFYFPTITWIIIISWLSLTDSGLPKVELELPVPLDKCAHFVMYFILAFLLIRSVFAYSSLIHYSYALLFILFLIISFFGIVIEFLQANFTLTRKMEFFDVVANSIGNLCGLLCFKYLKVFQKI
jgi:VanZ family protein